MPFIGIVGQQFSGKRSVADYLIDSYGFIELSISNNGLPHQYPTLDDAVKYATSHWKDKLLIMDIDRYKGHELAMKRPFFLMIWVDAPTSVRYRRYLEESKDDQMTLSELTLEESKWSTLELQEFILQDELQLYTPYGQQVSDSTIYNDSTNLYSFMDQCQLKLFNHSSNLAELFPKVDRLNILDSELYRPSWDTYFMALCELASKRSNCMKRRVGCIIVSENRVISTGYNGTPKGVKNCNEGGCDRCNGNASCGSSLDHCVCLHAEEVNVVNVECAARSRP
jgi:dCMP deaminase